MDAVEDCELLLLTMAALNGSCCRHPGVVETGGGGVGVAAEPFCCCCWDDAAAAAAAAACAFALLVTAFLLAFTGGGPGMSGKLPISAGQEITLSMAFDFRQSSPHSYLLRLFWESAAFPS